MGGRASLIMVVGFAMIFGYINFNLARLTNRAAENMVGYNQISVSRNMATTGANVGLAMLTYKNYPHKRLLSTKKYTTGAFAGSGYSVKIDSLSIPKPHLLLTCASECTTFVFLDSLKTKPMILRDTVQVRFDYFRPSSFSSFGWMSNNENGVSFTTGDTLWGKIHSNSDIYINNRPVFWGKVTTSGKWNPSIGSAEFWGGKEKGVAKKTFPTDLTGLSGSATNLAAFRSSELYVELKPGTTADNDGYAIICTTGFAGAGGTKVDSIALSDFTNNVIYSSKNVHVKGTLDGRLSIGSSLDIKIEGNTVYERAPDASVSDWSAPANQTKDMLGLVATSDVIIPSSYHGNIAIHASIFAKDGSFTAENWSGPSEGRINLIGSICQNLRGAVGTTTGGGYKKSYRFDPRFANEDDENYHPPSFPSYDLGTTLTIKNWWESPRIPFDVTQFY